MNRKHPRKISLLSSLLYKLATKLLPIKRKMILFESNAGRNYTGNPKYIYEEMVKRGLDHHYECVWIVRKTDTVIPGNRVIVRRLSMRYLFYMAVAQIWVFDCRQPYFVIKRKQQTYIQTWHGTPLKRLAMDMEVINMGGELDLANYQEGFINSTRKWDVLLSPNTYSSHIFRRAFAFDKTMLEIGYPRNDILVNSGAEQIALLKDKLKLPHDKKIILYAPTWRDDEYHSADEFRFNLQMDLNVMAAELSDEYMMILKVHYLVKENFDATVYDGFVQYFSAEQDIQELYLVSDILITDYSSVMFDYSLLRRPMIFYTYDYEHYADNIRGFYYDLADEAPGPLVRHTNELIDAIRTSEVDMNSKYKARYDQFFNKYNHLDDGQASTKVIEFIESLH